MEQKDIIFYQDCGPNKITEEEFKFLIRRNLKLRYQYCGIPTYIYSFDVLKSMAFVSFIGLIYFLTFLISFLCL